MNTTKKEQLTYLSNAKLRNDNQLFIDNNKIKILNTKKNFDKEKIYLSQNFHAVYKKYKKIVCDNIDSKNNILSQLDTFPKKEVYLINMKSYINQTCK